MTKLCTPHGMLALKSNNDPTEYHFYIHIVRVKVKSMQRSGT